MAKRLVYFNGEFVPESEARISIFDCALMYGDMVFEMTRSFGQKPFRLREHLERLYGSLKYAQIDCGLDIDEMEEVTHETIARNLPAIGALDFQIMHGRHARCPAAVQYHRQGGHGPHCFHQRLPAGAAYRRDGAPLSGGGALCRPVPAVGALALHRSQGQKSQPHLLQDRRVAGCADGSWCPGAFDR